MAMTAAAGVASVSIDVVRRRRQLGKHRGEHFQHFSEPASNDDLDLFGLLTFCSRSLETFQLQIARQSRDYHYTMTDGVFQLGQRVACDGFVGTVRYIGSVINTNGEWLGIDWDNETRGKHDGAHAGHRYFTARSDKSGSFIRPKLANTGVDFLTAVKSRYSAEAPVVKSAGDSLYIVTKSNDVQRIEAVGMEKIREKQGNLTEIRTVCLSDMFVNGVSPDDDLATLLPNLTELDLSGSLLSTWSAVAEICRQLPRLTELNVSKNRLSLPAERNSLAYSFTNVKVLKITHMDYNWNEVASCAAMCPAITELLASHNSITTISSEPSIPTLEALDIESNTLVDGSGDVCRLSAAMPSLRHLNISNTGLDSLRIEIGTFPRLCSLVLNDNKMSDWKPIDELNNLPSITELIIRSNPLMDSEKPANIRQQLIARVAGLKILNRTTIGSDERQGAEVDYLKIAMAQPTFHPRFNELVKLHGEPVATKQVTSNLKSSLLDLELWLVNNPDDQSICIHKKLPGSITVQKAKALAQKLFAVGQEDLVVSYRTPVVEMEYPLTNELASLSFFDVKSGDLLIFRRP